MIKFFEKLLSLIYIQPCCFCKSTKEDKILCSKCKSRIHFLDTKPYRNVDYTKIYACTFYDEITKKLIKDLKYHNKKNISKAIAGLMYDYWQKLNIQEDFLIVPVPIHKLRLKERKYNHMDLIADEFSKLSGYKTAKKFLMRIKDTQKQYKLHKQERIKNIKGAFNINEEEKPQETVNLLIIDDITSTGTTLKEIITLLEKNGYKKITALAFSTPELWN